MHGVDETEKENTDTLTFAVLERELGIALTEDDIQRSHRLGPIKDIRSLRSARKNPRPINIKFTNFRKRKEVFKAKRNLKGEGISISENLTKSRYDHYKAALTKFGRGNVWTMEGRVTTKIENTYFTINRMVDLDNY